MADKTLKVVITGVTKDIQKALAAVRADADATKTKLSSISSSMAATGRAMTMRVTAPIVAGMALAVKAGAEEQQQMEVLANTLRKNIPGATQETIDANEAWITSMQNATGVADGELRASMEHLLIAGMDIEESQAAMATAMDVAAAKGLDLETVTKAMAKAHAGNTGALGKLGIATKDANGKALTMEQIMANLADTMGGAAATAADTAAGRAEILKLKMGDLTEDIGMILIPVLEKLTGWLSKVVDWFSNLSPQAKEVGVVILGIAAAVGPVLIVGSKLIKGFQAVGTAFSVLSKLMMTNPWLLLIAAVIALVVLIVTNWDKIKAFLAKTWDWIKETAGKVWDFLKGIFQKGLDFVKNLFLNWTGPGLLIKHWDNIKAAVTGVKDWIVDKWNAIIDFFKKIPERIGRAVAGMWDGIKTAFKSAVNWILRKWNDLEISIGGGTILGVSIPKITIRTPNIPLFDAGGVVPGPLGSHMLAILQAGERVTPANGGGEVIELHNHIYLDGRQITESIRLYNRSLLPV